MLNDMKQLKHDSPGAERRAENRVVWQRFFLLGKMIGLASGTRSILTFITLDQTCTCTSTIADCGTYWFTYFKFKTKIRRAQMLLPGAEMVHYVGGTDDRGDEVSQRDRVPKVGGCHM